MRGHEAEAAITMDVTLGAGAIVHQYSLWRFLQLAASDAPTAKLQSQTQRNVGLVYFCRPSSVPPSVSGHKENESEPGAKTDCVHSGAHSEYVLRIPPESSPSTTRHPSDDSTLQAQYRGTPILAMPCMCWQGSGLSNASDMRLPSVLGRAGENRHPGQLSYLARQDCLRSCYTHQVDVVIRS